MEKVEIWTMQRQEVKMARTITNKEVTNKDSSLNKIILVMVKLSSTVLSKKETSGRQLHSLLPPTLLRKVPLIITTKRGSFQVETAIF